MCIIASRWVDEMREREREKRKAPGDKTATQEKKEKTQKQNRVKCTWEENKRQWVRKEGIVPGSQAAGLKNKAKH